MREIDKVFLSIFKDIKIVNNPSGGYSAYINSEPKQAISNSEVVGLVQKYQDLLIEEILNMEAK